MSNEPKASWWTVFIWGLVMPIIGVFLTWLLLMYVWP